MSTVFSILIPTFNRREKLRVVLEELGKQKGIENGEVIVGIDGSTDGTEEMLTEMKINHFCIENSGRSVIRNELLKRATGDLIIFIQDDIVPSEHWLDSHLNFHLQAKAYKLPSGLVGHVTWYPKATITPYMYWLENGGHLLDFSGLKDGDEVDFWHFYMGNISIPRGLIEDLRFDETLKGYGWEDVLFGKQFVEKGNKIFYSKEALAWHWDEYQEEDLPKYMEKLARSAKEVEAKYPGFGAIPKWWKRVMLWLMIGVGRIFSIFLPQRWRWYLQMKKEFLRNC